MLSSTADVVLTETNVLRVSGLPIRLAEAVRRYLTVANPVYRDAKQFGRSTRNLSPTIEYFEELGGALVIPRGVTAFLLQLCQRHDIAVQVVDRTHRGHQVDMNLQVTLSPAQCATVAAVGCHPKGQLVAAPGSGKTVMGLAIVARRRQPTLWLTHTAELAKQTRERACEVLGLRAADIGMFGGGKKSIGAELTIGMVQTLARDIPRELLSHVGHVVVDECHHTPARQMSSVVAAFPAKYLLGLSATPYRRDGLGAVIGYYLGPPTGTMRVKDLADRLVRPCIQRRNTDITVHADSFTSLVTKLVNHQGRNQRIVRDVAEAAQRGRKILVLTDRVDHAEELTRQLRRAAVAVDILHGQRTVNERATVRAAMMAGELSVVVATTQLVGEGWDCPVLDTLFLVTPLSYHGRLTQYVGRIARTADGKRGAQVIDYTDDNAMLWASWAKRRDAYDAAGYERTVA